MAVWLFDFGALKILEPNSAPATKVKKIKTFFAISPKTLRKGCTKCKLRILIYAQLQPSQNHLHTPKFKSQNQLNCLKIV